MVHQAQNLDLMEEFLDVRRILAVKFSLCVFSYKVLHFQVPCDGGS